MEGADLIQAEVIHRLRDEDMVLCDMSGLNPNVFLELGIRTAQNKSVCMVRDEHTPKIPFDTAPITAHEYKSELSGWKLPGEIERLSKHVVKSAQRKDNALWTYFGLKIVADSTETKHGVENEMSLLRLEIEALRKQIEPKKRPTLDLSELEIGSSKSTEEIKELLVGRQLFAQKLVDAAKTDGVEISVLSENPVGNEVRIRRTDKGRIPASVLWSLQAIGMACGMKVKASPD